MATPDRSVVHIVDDDEAVRDSMRALLESYGMQVRDYSSAQQFLAANRNAIEGCLLLDLHMPGMTGLELLETLRKRGSRPPAIIMTGRSDSHLRERAVRSGAITLLDKPVDDDVLLHSLDRALSAAEHRA